MTKKKKTAPAAKPTAKETEPKTATHADYSKLEKKLAKTEHDLEEANKEIAALRTYLLPPEVKPTLPPDAPDISQLPPGCIMHGGHPETAQAGS